MITSVVCEYGQFVVCATAIYMTRQCSRLINERLIGLLDGMFNLIKLRYKTNPDNTI